MKIRVSLFPSTFLWRKESRGLLYNSDTGMHIHFEITSPSINVFCKKMEDEKNLYSVEYDTRDLDDECKRFFSLIKEHRMGILTPSQERIITYPPNPHVINNITRIQDNGQTRINALEFLDCLIIYLGGKGNNNSWYLQTTHPFGTSTEFSKNDVITVFSKTRAMRDLVYKVVISKKEDSRILDIISIARDKSISFIFNPESLNGNLHYINKIKSAGHKIVLSMAPEDFEAYDKSDEDFTHLASIVDRTQFLINSVHGSLKAEELESSYGLTQTEFIPVWDNNPDFCFENVLIDEHDIFSTKVNKKGIHRHQLINVHFWGNLIIMPNGDVYSDINMPKLGTIANPLHSLISQELNTGASWLRIRDFEPCNSCLYQWLCPSPSSFETLSGHTVCKINLSFINDSNSSMGQGG